jgi:hypothetical protein
MGTIFLRKFRDGEGPGDPDLRVDYMKGPFRQWPKRRGVQIEHLAVLREGLEAVGKPLRDQEAPVVMSAEYLSVPFQEGRGTLPDVDGHIEHLPEKATDDLAFGVRRMLEMQAADSAPVKGPGVVDLGDGATEPDLLKRLRAEESAEKPPRILDGLQLDNQQTLQGCGMKIEPLLSPGTVQWSSRLFS